MRRIRTSEPGAVVLFERTAGTRQRGTRIEVDHQIAADADVRKLLDRIRVALGDALRGVSTEHLRPQWQLDPIAGGPASASTAIVTASGPRYLDRVFDRRTDEIVPRVIREWLADAVPKTGEVNTEVTPNTAGGPIPFGGKR